MYEVGVTRYFDSGYYLSAGYFYSEASTSSLYFTPMVPDTNLHIGSLGGGYKGQTWSWALALQIIGGGWRNVAVDPSVNQTVNGRYQALHPYALVQRWISLLSRACRVVEARNGVSRLRLPVSSEQPGGG